MSKCNTPAPLVSKAAVIKGVFRGRRALAPAPSIFDDDIWDGH